MTTQTDVQRFDRLCDVMAEAVMETPDAELMAEPGAAEDAEKSRAIIKNAIRQAAHDHGDWMDWQKGEAWVHDGWQYEAEMLDGSLKIVTAEVYGAEEVSLHDGADYLDDNTVSRIRRL